MNIITRFRNSLDKNRAALQSGSVRISMKKTVKSVLKGTAYTFILATFITAAGTPDPISTLLTEVEKSLHCVERAGRKDKSTYLLNDTATERAVSLFTNKTLITAEKNFLKVKSELEKLAKKMNSSYTSGLDNANRLAELTVRYMGVLTKFHIYYGVGVHGKYKKDDGNGGKADFISDPQNYTFKDLKKFNLVYPKKISYPVYAKLPFYVTHKSLKEFEFSLSDQEVVMAEHTALEEPVDVESYGKLLQHAVIRESLVNRWSVRRFKWFNFKQQDLVNKSCAYGLLAYRPDGSSVETIPAYKELVNTDTFYELANDIPKINDSIKDTGLSTDTKFYKDLLVSVASSTPNFKLAYEAHIKTVVPSKFKTTDEMLDNYAEDLKNAEMNDWNYPTGTDQYGNPDPSKTIGVDALVSSSTPRDDHDPVALSLRMAENAFARRSQSVSEVVSIYINDMMGAEDVDSVINSAQKILDKKEKEWVTAQTKVIYPQVQYLLSPGYRSKRSSEMKYAKIQHALDVSMNAIQASWDMQFIGAILSNEDNDYSEHTLADQIKTMGTYDGYYTTTAFKAAITTPEDLYGYFESKLSADERYKTYLEIYKERESVRKEVDAFFENTMNRFESNKANGTMTGDILAQTAAYEAYKIEKTMLLNYKLKNKKDYFSVKLEEEQKKTAQDYQKKYQTQTDNTFVYKKPIYELAPKVEKPNYKNQVKVWTDDEIKTAITTGKNPKTPPKIPMLATQVSDELMTALKEEDEKRECGESAQVTSSWLKPVYENSQTSLYKLATGSVDAVKNTGIDDIMAVFNILSVVNLNYGYQIKGMDADYKTFTKNTQFIPTLNDHRHYANFKISQALTAAPILSQSFSYAPDEYAAKSELKPLIHHLKEAYHLSKAASGYTIDKDKAKAIITKFINVIQLDNSLESFCNVGTARLNIDHGSGSGFSKLFKASTATRVAIDPEGKYKDFEEKMRKGTRSGTEWFLEEFVYSIGWTIFFLAIFFLPAFLPAIGLISAASVPAMVSFLQVVTYPFFLAGTVARLSVNFIEQPALFKYQEAIAKSYVGDAKTLMSQAKSIVDTEGLKNEIAMNKINKWMEVVLLPLDIWMGKLTLRDVRVITGKEMVKQGKKLNIDVKLTDRQPMKIRPSTTYKAAIKETNVITGTVKYTSSLLASSLKEFENWLVKKGSNITAEELEKALQKRVAEHLPDDLTKVVPEFDQAIEFRKLRLTKAEKRVATTSTFKPKSMTIEEYAVLNDLKMDKAMSWATSPNLSQFGLYSKLTIKKYWGKLMGNKADVNYIVSEEFVKRTRQILELNAIYSKGQVTALRNLKKKFLAAATNKTAKLALMESLTREELTLLHDVGRMMKFFGKGVLKPRATALFKKGPLQTATIFFDAADYIRPLLKPVQHVPNSEAFLSLADDQNPYDVVQYYNTENAYDDMKKDLNHWYYLIETFDGVNETSPIAEQLRNDLKKYFGE